MKGITLEIYYYSDDQMKQVELGIGEKIPIKDCKKKKMTFFNFAAIAPYEEDGDMFTAIHCNGTDFISPVDYEKLKRHIIEEL